MKISINKTVLVCFCVFILMFSVTSAYAVVTPLNLSLHETFDAEGYVPSEIDGYSILDKVDGDVIKVVDGALQWSNDTAGSSDNGNKRFLALNFDKVTTGKLIVEFKYLIKHNSQRYTEFNKSSGFVTLLSESGANAVKFMTRNQLANTATCLSAGETKTLNNRGWWNTDGNIIKVVADLDKDTFELYQNGNRLYSGNDNTFAFSEAANDITTLKIHFCRDAAIDDLKVYKEVSAEQRVTQYELLIGEKKKAEIIYSPSGESISDLVWSSSNNDVASVNATGEIDAKSKGKTTISAVSAIYGKSFLWEVTVGDPATDIIVIPDTLTITKGEIKKLNYKLFPEGSTAGIVSWRSADTNVATVDGEGNVTGIRNGNVEIIVEGSIGGVQGSCVLSVVTPITGVSISPSSVNLNVGDTFALAPQITPSDASDAPLKWSSGNHYVATVDQNGVVKAIGAGSTQIYISSSTASGNCTVTVSGETVSKDKTRLISYMQNYGTNFGDLNDITWAQSSILFVVSNEIMKPDSETSFGATRNITRGEFVSAVLKALNLSEKRVRASKRADFEGFSDVPDTHEHYSLIMKAFELDIIKGIGENKFDPDNYITRQDMAVVVHNALNVASVKLEDSMPAFSDNDMIANYAKTSVGALAGEKIILGNGSEFLPLNNATRAEVAVIADRIKKLKER